MGQSEHINAVRPLVEQLFEGLNNLERLEPELLEESALSDFQIILSYLPDEDRERLLHLLSEKSDGLVLDALESLTKDPAVDLQEDIAQSLFQSLNTYRRRQSFDALFSPNAIAEVCAILAEGQ